MSGRIDSSGFAPGAQMPHKYVRTGPNYARFGEQAGYLYFPQTDSYYIDPKAVQKQYEDQGIVDKPPGLAETLLPVAAGGAALYGGRAIGDALPDLFKGAKGLIGLGGDKAAGAATDAVTSATTATAGANAGAAFPVGTAANGGTLMSDGTIAAQGGLFDLGSGGLLGEGSMPLGNYVPGVVGAYGMYDLLKNKKHGGAGALQGAASGAGIGFTVGGPVGAGIGAAVGGLTGYFGNFGDVDAWKKEGDALRGLSEKGTYIPPQLIANMPTKGRSKEELIAIEQQRGGNVQFAGSRNEADLKGADIANYSAFAKKDPEWFKRPMEQRLAYAEQVAATPGAVREHHGTIDIDFSKAPPAPWETKATPAAATSTPPAQKSLTPEEIELWNRRNGKNQNSKRGLLAL